MWKKVINCQQILTFEVNTSRIYMLEEKKINLRSCSVYGGFHPPINKRHTTQILWTTLHAGGSTPLVCTARTLWVCFKQDLVFFIWLTTVSTESDKSNMQLNHYYKTLENIPMKQKLLQNWFFGNIFIWLATCLAFI